MKKKIITLILLSSSFLTMISAQMVSVQGRVIDKVDKDGIVGVKIEITSGVNRGRGATSDTEGYFRLQITNTFPIQLRLEKDGYNQELINLDELPNGNISVGLTPTKNLEANSSASTGLIEKVSIYEAPIPIDVYDAEELGRIGHTTIDEMLHYRAPSFNATQQAVSDGTAFFNPADLRTLGPGRTLVLLNKKRKNPSSLIYINDTPGKGEVGVDLNAIPINAIEKIEILRDGASTQYGSDAIAGVVNIQLKEGAQYSSLELFSGLTEEGDGFRYGTRFNTGVNLGDNGYLNVYSAVTQQNETNRANTPEVDSLILDSLGRSFTADTAPWIADNPDLGMRIGLPNMTTLNLGYNTRFSIKDSLFAYSFASLMERSAQTYALYRTPYWVPDPNNIFHSTSEDYEGFLPTLEGDISDQFFCFGIEGKARDWEYDLSYTYGKNSLEYLVNNTQNPSLGALSPTTFSPGGYSFSSEMVELVTNRRLSKNAINSVHELNPIGRFYSLGAEDSPSASDKTIGYLRFGLQYRKENFISMAGQEESFIGDGSISFPGIQPQNALSRSRVNFGLYSDIIFDIRERTTVGAGLRYEDYSDFDDNISWKGFLRYRVLENDRLALRGSVSRGFRAPTLHQLYLSNIQTLVSGNTVSNQGTFNQESPILRTLRAPNLRNEISTNYSLGLTSFSYLNTDSTSSLSINFDAYLIRITDRVVYSGSIEGGADAVLSGILDEFDITSLKYFTNGISSTSSGVEFNATYKGRINSRKQGFYLRLSGFVSQNEINDILTSSQIIEDAAVSFFDRKEQSRVLSSRPRTKISFNSRIDLNRGGRSAVDFFWNYFGPVTWQHASDEEKDETFSGKHIFSLAFQLALTKSSTLNLTVNNLFNTYPDSITKGDALTNLGGRFRYPWEVNQFGYNGRIYSMSVRINL